MTGLAGSAGAGGAEKVWRGPCQAQDKQSGGADARSGLTRGRSVCNAGSVVRKCGFRVLYCPILSG